MKNLSAVGKFLRKLRIDHLLNQLDLATALGISVAFYSAVESSRKPMPADLKRKIIEHYQLSEAQVRELDHAIERSKTEVKISMEELDDSTKELVACFARNFKTLEEADKARIREILKI
jgi:transcriptional regulator with XRE-family HTH domain